MFKLAILFSLISSTVFAQFIPLLVDNPQLIGSEEFAFAVQEPPPKQEPMLAPSGYKGSWDINMSPYAGGEDLLFATRVLEKCETILLEKSPLASSKEAYARFWRLSELVLGWLPLNYFTMVVQHEVFGHGYRIRDIGRSKTKVNGYSFGTPPPYGQGGGSTSYSFNDDLTTTDETAISMGGVESTAILALLTKFKWLESGRIDPRQSVLYLFSQHDLNMYIGSLKSLSDEELSGHDIHGYIRSLNYTYPDNLLSKGRLRTLSWINLADVFTYYAIYSWFHYLSCGKEAGIPMIASCYLPGLRLGLTPFGPEVFFENFFSLKKQPLYAYVKGGHHAKNDYYGAGVYAPALYKHNVWSFGLRLDLWRQPKLLLHPGTIPLADINFNQQPTVQNPLYPSSERHAIRYGAAGSIIAFYRGSERCGFETEAGYKAQGFLPGYSLRASPVVRLALVIQF